MHSSATSESASLRDVEENVINLKLIRCATWLATLAVHTQAFAKDIVYLRSRKHDRHQGGHQKTCCGKRHSLPPANHILACNTNAFKCTPKRLRPVLACNTNAFKTKWNGCVLN